MKNLVDQSKLKIVDLKAKLYEWQEILFLDPNQEFDFDKLVVDFRSLKSATINLKYNLCFLLF